MNADNIFLGRNIFLSVCGVGFWDFDCITGRWWWFLLLSIIHLWT